MMPETGIGMSKQDKAEEKKRQALQSALYMLNQVQQLVLLDAKQIKRNKKAIGLLMQARDLLDDLIGDEDMEDEDDKELPKSFRMASLSDDE